MTSTLTAEQISQGWKLTSGRIALAYDELPHPYQTMNFAGHISPIFLSGDSEPYWQKVFAYRTFSPDLPSPPVSGEAVKLKWQERNLMFNGIRVGGIIADAGLFYACFMSRSVLIAPSFSAEKDAMDNVELAVREWLSPLTAEQLAQGWKLVPNEATQDMLDAYYNAHKERFAPLRPAEIYSVMLAAAPLPSPPVSGEAVGQFDTSDYVIVGSDGKPRRNEPVVDHIPDPGKMVEPVGVTISREDAQAIIAGISNNPKFPKAIALRDRLSAAIGERG